MKYQSILALVFSFSTPSFAQKLPRLNIDPGAITVSGISSGAFMATQMQVAYSALVAGSASVAGGPYLCAAGQAHRAHDCMSSPENIRTQDLLEGARRAAREGKIDALDHLSKRNYFIFVSAADATVHEGNAEKLAEFWRAFAPAGSVRILRHESAAHGFPTLDHGLPCATAGIPWIIDCDVDGAGEILSSLYGGLTAPGIARARGLRRFAQGEFGDKSARLYRRGWIYVPETCAKGVRCKLHLALHGCQMNPDFVQNQFAARAGYNRWAEANDIVVLYPQAAKSARDNPAGCWDWFGLTGADYATQDGPQMRALRSMIRAVSGL